MRSERSEKWRALTAAMHQRLTEALHLQALEANPLLPDEVAMLEREGWTAGDRRAYITQQFEHLRQSAVVE